MLMVRGALWVYLNLLYPFRVYASCGLLWSRACELWWARERAVRVWVLCYAWVFYPWACCRISLGAKRTLTLFPTTSVHSCWTRTFHLWKMFRITSLLLKNRSRPKRIATWRSSKNLSHGIPMFSRLVADLRSGCKIRRYSNSSNTRGDY